MKLVDLGSLDPDASFKIKMEAYLYIDAGKLLEYGKGDPKKVRTYMERRVEIIEEMLKLSRPFRLVVGKETLLRVNE